MKVFDGGVLPEFDQWESGFDYQDPPAKGFVVLDALDRFARINPMPAQRAATVAPRRDQNGTQ